MKHPFIKSLSDAEHCMLCHRENDAHGSQAECESCGNIGNCEIEGRLDNPKALMLCEACAQMEHDANSVSIARGQVERSIKVIDVKTVDDRGLPVIEKVTIPAIPDIEPESLSGQTLIEHARALDRGMTFETYFNAETISIRDLAVSLDNDTSLTTTERAHKLHALVLERIESYRPEIIEYQDKIHERVIKQQAGIKYLRDFGNEVRAEIREKLKTADATYIPQTVVKPKVVSAKKSPMEKMIEAYALMEGISKSEAEERLLKGMNK